MAGNLRQSLDSESCWSHIENQMESESSGEGIRLNIAAKRKKTYFWHIIQGFLDSRYFWPLPRFKTDAPHVVPPLLKNEDPPHIET